MTEQVRRRELDLSSSFCRTVYSEIEEVGWENLVRLGEDLTSLSFRITFGTISDLKPNLQGNVCFAGISLEERAVSNCSRHLFLSDRDEKGRVHIMEILLDKAYPKCPPSVSADVPYIFKLEWSMNSRLKDAVQQFQEHVEKLQDFWSTLDDIDRSLWVVDPKQPHRATSFRQINTGDDCSIMLLINANDPRSIPEMKGKLLPENLASVLDTQLPGPPDAHKSGQHSECGICYAQYLPIDDELGAKSGSGTDYTCDNNTCSRAFHSVCLGDWLRSITTTRQSFDVLFGNCPYCSEPVAVKISTKK
ncbi:hypothetical protein RJ640_030625 [Escallonia rubra]|uniref:E3 ubiquitin-protein ligase FANCL n=1 Tax=Escallonia rubra TaxID=112253 RepID=A0AA88RLB7_9ASTE|nr:hypothetical protein RJ640_030625 [Escallonia rubra]